MSAFAAAALPRSDPENKGINQRTVTSLSVEKGW